MQSIRLCRHTFPAFRRARFRSYTSGSTIPPLPPPESWRDTFNSTMASSKDRVQVKSPETARRVVNSFLADSLPAGEGKIIIEAFPGPGALSRALLELPKSQVKKLIILEDNEEFLKWLKPLEEADPRVKVVPYSGYEWDTYTFLQDAGLLSDVVSVPWESGLHPQLHFISHLQHTIKGEQLIAQLFRCIPERSWLYKYGRIPMSFVLSDWVWQRISAPPPLARRCKLTVIAEAVASFRLTLDPESLLPYDDHFHPPTPKSPSDRRPETRRPGYPLVAMNIIPYEDQIIQIGNLDKWDYCLRRLFVLKSTSLKRAISSLAPGAITLLKVLTDPNIPPHQHVDTNKTIRQLTVADWALILRAFSNWPFAPEDLMISDAFSRQNAVRVVI
ncbi:S-adenosyl-L-methionine-dependent methyltransferase [Wolfiporia cocos MD-104 SS10]|uniref:rRNA adenine N(6)-methyltransferase n=1 Tax=Wolfiporia cocos (strain MD-104) TaxID=742152 RepID=A0A2H3JUU9_WOLCO|nr:S-adenosyl-L-methionine-dependent methyltransferase [Wolfiporia cocos MD-104 SS10]